MPAGQVVDVARDCAAAGVRALVVLSAGFSEVGEAGERRQHELVAVCRAAGMRLVGPNCLGVINTEPAISLNASFAPGAPPPGRVGFASQSGAFGIAALDLARTHGIGVGGRLGMPLKHVTMFDDAHADDSFHGLVQDVEGGYTRSVALVLPEGPTWGTAWARKAWESCWSRPSRHRSPRSAVR